jgi:hypothetical protein
MRMYAHNHKLRKISSAAYCPHKLRKVPRVRVALFACLKPELIRVIQECEWTAIGQCLAKLCGDCSQSRYPGRREHIRGGETQRT